MIKLQSLPIKLNFWHRGYFRRVVPNSMIGLLILILIMGWMISAAGAFEMPRSKKPMPFPEEAEVRVFLEGTATFFKQIQHWLFVGVITLRGWLQPRIDVFLGLMVVIGGAFVPDIPGGKGQTIGTMSVEVEKTARISLRGAPRYFVVFSGLLIVVASLYAWLFGHPVS